MIRFTKYKISLAPNNASAWNYLRGYNCYLNHFFIFDFSIICFSVLEHTSTPLSSIEAFVVPYTKSKSEKSEEPELAVDLDDPLPSPQAELPCALAVEFLADICVEKTSQGINADESLRLANELYGTLAKELDPMRQRYIHD